MALEFTTKTPESNPAPKELLFTLDGEEYYIRSSYPVATYMKYLDIMTTMGPVAASNYAMTMALGRDVWHRVLDAGISDRDIATLAVVVTSRITGVSEDLLHREASKAATVDPKGKTGSTGQKPKPKRTSKSSVGS